MKVAGLHLWDGYCNHKQLCVKEYIVQPPSGRYSHIESQKLDQAWKDTVFIFILHFCWKRQRNTPMNLTQGESITLRILMGENQDYKYYEDTWQRHCRGYIQIETFCTIYSESCNKWMKNPFLKYTLTGKHCMCHLLSGQYLKNFQSFKSFVLFTSS